MEYDENTVLTFGFYKRCKIKDVPIAYLLKFYRTQQKIQNKIPTHEALCKYIHNNVREINLVYSSSQRIKQHELENKVKKQENGLSFKVSRNYFALTCKATKKTIYPSQSDAKRQIKRIRELKQKNKKPVRAYECEKCGGWHLTSKYFYKK